MCWEARSTPNIQHVIAIWWCFIGRFSPFPIKYHTYIIIWEHFWEIPNCKHMDHMEDSDSYHKDGLWFLTQSRSYHNSSATLTKSSRQLIETNLGALDRPRWRKRSSPQPWKQHFGSTATTLRPRLWSCPQIRCAMLRWSNDHRWYRFSWIYVWWWWWWWWWYATYYCHCYYILDHNS